MDGVDTITFPREILKFPGLQKDIYLINSTLRFTNLSRSAPFNIPLASKAKSTI